MTLHLTLEHARALGLPSPSTLECWSSCERACSAMRSTSWSCERGSRSTWHRSNGSRGHRAEAAEGKKRRRDEAGSLLPGEQSGGEGVAERRVVGGDAHGEGVLAGLAGWDGAVEAMAAGAEVGGVAEGEGGAR
jgi:hypothetical protein